MSEHKNNIKGKAMRGLAWKFAEKIGMQGMQLIIQIVLARLLLPEEYGIVGLLTIFTAISDVFILQGFTTALIQKKDADELDYSSVFIANIIMSIAIYAILFLAAPLVAIFYHEPGLSAVMRVMSLNVVLGAISAVHNAVLSKALDFKKSFFRGLANVGTQGIIGIALALWGSGVWALVFSKLSGVLVGSIVLYVTVNWKPQRKFSAARVKSLFSYSSKVLGANLINTIFNNIHSIVIGRFFTSADLGHYQRGQQIPQTMMAAVDGSMSEVLYPILSLVQDDIDKLRSALRRSMKLSIYVTLPMLMGLLAVAEPLTIILLTEKWSPSIPYLKLACIVCAFWPLAIRKQAINAIGKSNITFKLSLISKSITLTFILICVKYGIYSIMLGTIAASFIDMWITSYYVQKYIKYTVMEFVSDIMPSVLLSISMAVIVSMLSHLTINIYTCLIMQIMVGIVVYAAGSFVFKIESFTYLLAITKDFCHKR